MSLNPIVDAVTQRIVSRSAEGRPRYLARLDAAVPGAPYRGALGCTNLAHGFAASPPEDKLRIKAIKAPNIGIVTAYNDMLSAHQPYGVYPDIIKSAARAAGATAQVAGGVPAMCDGITQGQDGMDLSLFSRDVIAMSTAVALSHNMFDAGLCLGICDKIVPGLVMGALRFGHLPFIFVPAGPMPTGISNDQKAKVRQKYVAGEVGKDALLESESQSYHAPGTCTFYGTANSNQMMMEMMGLHLPGAAFVPPGTPLREALTRAATRRALQITSQGDAFTPLGRMIDERSIVNAIVGLLATGGSTNHTMHLVAMARMAGILIDWSDFESLSKVVPLIARVYPNGAADVNQFHAAGGMAWVVRELLSAGLVHADVRTVVGQGLAAYAQAPALDASGNLVWQDIPAESGDASVLATAAQPFSADGGLRLLAGNLGRAVIKVSAVKPAQRVIRAPAIVFESQDALLAAAKAGELERDFIAVLRFQGPQAIGMPELHQLTPTLANLQDKGFRVALVTDGRMSGASGKIPAAIHVTPEALAGGPIARVQDGDMIELDAEAGILRVESRETNFDARSPAVFNGSGQFGMGRELFGVLRKSVSGAEQGATVFSFEE
ncbi:phosphogluconate dehydratase [Uliginosibacterium sp. 31-16]|uniref:phosphogluconate dehydratase n=1 Tax=Uliginosibacterium sp. 31-16 TaxID=3068315 RepID=UPI00273F4858|nr:phosphogluconate dehydratase [Uliginosibacterium sp. 31-16]MDP5241398.1 phosphogluconate dehydratase [Uliginosibacterium sp. 31-16]